MNRNYKWIIIFITALYFIIPAKAQTEKVDSIISILQLTPKQGKVDTNVFRKISPILRHTKLTDHDVERIVQVANKFRTGDDEDMSLFICYNIFLRLSSTDWSKSIDFAKQTLERIEKSCTPEKKYIRSIFLIWLTNPFRNHSRLAEGFSYLNKYQITCQELNDSSGLVVCNAELGNLYRTVGLFERAIYHLKKSMSYLDSSKLTSYTYFGGSRNDGMRTFITLIGRLGEYNFLKGDVENAVRYLRLSLQLSRNEKFLEITTSRFITLAKCYLLKNRLDSAAFYLQLSYDSVRNNPYSLSAALQVSSNLELKKGNFNKADSFLVETWKVTRKYNLAPAVGGIIHPDYYYALIRMEQKNYAAAAGFLKNDINRVVNLRSEKLQDYKLLAEVYDKMGETAKSKETYKSFIILQDSILVDQAKYSAISFETEQKMNEKELSINQLKSDNKITSITRNISFAMVGLFLLIAGILYYRYKSKQKDNAFLEKTLTDLKATQTQLIQSEKMASLGELTAGIAHEIQNPLNFVNNFSEVSTELVDEMNKEMEKGNLEDAKEIAADLKQNLEKINHHGKRAGEIVKGMLQHSRTSSGQKEPTNINALADEYLRLAYHGLRAKDNSFNATIKTEFDEIIGDVNIIPQDIGRVILNLITNSFYAVSEKKKIVGEGFEPTVTVATKKSAAAIMISVADNGNGIPQKIVDKIFQPFFTTKPTGQGTGLGLSLSYDIMKAHGGELKVETKEGLETVFTIVLPFSA